MKQILVQTLIFPLILTLITVTGLPVTHRVTIFDAAEPNIVGGEDAEPGEFPWQCSLKHEFILGATLHMCGAVVRTDRTVLTAAHCVENRELSKMQVVCGEYDFRVIEASEQRRNVSAVALHPGRNVGTKENDLAVLTLAAPLELNAAVQPIRLAPPDFQAAGKCTNTGWGNRRGDGSSSSALILQKVTLDLVPLPNCAERYEELIQIQDSMLCAGHVDPLEAEEQVGPCNGDSGGPLVCPDQSGRLVLAGIVSFGTDPCAQFQFPGVFANIQHLRQWLLEQDESDYFLEDVRGANNEFKKTV